jgi:uncharacterized repeat protein (TIGR03803 family)
MKLLLAAMSFAALAQTALGAPVQADFNVIYSLNGGLAGAPPNAPMVADHSGNLYGTTKFSGINCTSTAAACGAVFQLSGAGVFTILHGFTGTPDGGEPITGLTWVDGQLFGRTLLGGAYGVGTIFSMNPDGSNYQIRHNNVFGKGVDPYSPFPFLPAPGGGVYGLGQYGVSGNGVLYLWEPKDTVINLHNFTGRADGSWPTSLVQDQQGNLYGSTRLGGACTASRQGCGVIYEVNPTTRQFTTLYTFTGTEDGAEPLLGSVGADGTLYGISTPTQYQGGAGQIFTLSPTGAGYKFTLGKQVFSGNPGDTPTSGPQPGPDGTLVGTTFLSLYVVKNNQVFDYVPLDASSELLGPLTVTGSGTIYGVGVTGNDVQDGYLYSFSAKP